DHLAEALAQCRTRRTYGLHGLSEHVGVGGGEISGLKRFGHGGTPNARRGDQAGRGPNCALLLALSSRRYAALLLTSNACQACLGLLARNGMPIRDQARNNARPSTAGRSSFDGGSRRARTRTSWAATVRSVAAAAISRR